MTGLPPQRRALVVSLAATVAGAERSFLLLADRLPAHGWQPTLACPPGDFARLAAAAGVPVVSLAWRPVDAISARATGRKRYPPTAVAGALGASLANAVRVARLARGHDLVLSNSLHAHPFAALGARLAGRPAVWHLRDIVEEGAGRRLLTAAGRLASAVVAISEAVAATVAHPRLAVVANPVELPPAPLMRGAGREPVVGFLGRLDPEKGLEDLCAAAAEVPARFRVVGETQLAPPGYAERLHALAERHAPGRVDFAGAVADPTEALAGFDVLAVPSRREPFGRVAAEALAAGVPVVAADAGGLREVVRDGVDGLLYPPGDVTALAARLRELLAEPARRRRMGDAGREAARRFDPDIHARTVAAVLNGAARPTTTRRLRPAASARSAE